MCRRVCSSRSSIPLWLTAVAVAVALVTPQVTLAQTFEMSAGVNYPSPVVVGTNNVAVSITGANNSTLGGADYSTSITIRMTQMKHQVSCTINATPCPAAFGENPPVYTIVAADLVPGAVVG